MNAVQKMRPVATGVARSVVRFSVCSVCLCVGHTDVRCKTGLTDRDAVWGTDSCGPKEPCIRWGRDPHGKGQFRALSGPLKSIGSLCYGVHSKKDHSMLNNGRTCDAAFYQNALITCS